MGILNDIFGSEEDTKKEEANDDEAKAKLLLHKEELDINKSRVHKGDVEFSKEIIEEQKIVEVPVTREEVVIERRALENVQSDSPITDEETIRIPVSEEIVDVNKRTVVTGEISAHKRNVEDTKHIDETIKREEALVNKIGNPDVVDSVITDHH